MDVKANPGPWKGCMYDSQLERDWAATFTMWGMEFRYHPGQMFLPDGSIWEPDFQLDGDIIFEVKGAHDDRLWKAWAAREAGFNVIVGREGYVPPVADLEYAGAVWEPDEWVIVNKGSKLRWQLGADYEVEASYSARLAYENGLHGIRFFKAIGEHEVA